MGISSGDLKCLMFIEKIVFEESDSRGIRDYDLGFIEINCKMFLVTKTRKCIQLYLRHSGQCNKSIRSFTNVYMIYIHLSIQLQQ